MATTINTHNLKLIKEAINSIVMCLERMESEKEQIKEISKLVEEQTVTPAVYIKKIAKLIQKSQAVCHLQQSEEFDELLNEILNK